jgi:hypothetical protein
MATGQGSVSVNTCNPDLLHKSRSAAVISLETRAHVRLQQLCNFRPDIWGTMFVWSRVCYFFTTLSLTLIEILT